MRTRMRVRMQRYVDGGGVKTGMEVKTSAAQMLAWGWRLARSGRWRERRGEGWDAGKKGPGGEGSSGRATRRG